jgi:predicted sugar kinase
MLTYVIAKVSTPASKLKRESILHRYAQLRINVLSNRKIMALVFMQLSSAVAEKKLGKLLIKIMSTAKLMLAT